MILLLFLVVSSIKFDHGTEFDILSSQVQNVVQLKKFEILQNFY